MHTPEFWRAIDRIGSASNSLALWRLELGGELDAAMTCLRKVPGSAERIPDPDSQRFRRWMRVHPIDDEHVCIAESDDSPSHRAPFTVPAGDVSLLAPNWEVISAGLAPLLGFTHRYTPAQPGTDIRQIGISQPRIGITFPVFLYLPSGSFSDRASLLSGLRALQDCVLYVPTKRHLAAEVFEIAKPRNIAIEAIAERLSDGKTAAAATLSVVSALTGRQQRNAISANEPKAILAVQPGWVWEKLTIRLTEKGTLIAKYGQSQRGEHRFEKKIGVDGTAKYPLLFRNLFQTCVLGRWENPPRTQKGYAASQRGFARLRELLQTLVQIEGDPFRKVTGGWEPRFQFEPDRELAVMLDYQARRNSNRRVPASLGKRPHSDDEEGAESE